MTQRYADRIAHERMSAGNCPECGRPPTDHDGSVIAGCVLRSDGVTDRVRQYRADVEAGTDAHACPPCTHPADDEVRRLRQLLNVREDQAVRLRREAHRLERENVVLRKAVRDAGVEVAA